MARLLGLLLLIGLGWLIVRQLLGPPTRRREQRPPPRFEKTVQCERCGVHLPLSLAHRDRSDRIVCDQPACRERAHNDDDRSR